MPNRSVLLAAAVALICLSIPATASASLAMPDGTTKALYEHWLGDSALGVPAQPVTVELRNCGAGTAACIDWTGTMRFPDMGAIASDPDYYGPEVAAKTRSLFMHEIGHVIDLRLGGRGSKRKARAAGLRRDYRHQFQRIMRGQVNGGGERCWWDCGFSPDSERFADAYAYCAVSPHTMPRDHAYEGYGLYKPSDEQHNRVCHMLDLRFRGAAVAEPVPSAPPVPGPAVAPAAVPVPSAAPVAPGDGSGPL